MHLAAQPVDDDVVAVADVLGDVLQADHARDLERARQDRRVRGLAADVGAEGHARGAVQVRGVGRRQVVRDDHRARRRHRRPHVDAEQVAQDAIAHEVDVAAALAEVVLLDGVEDGLDLLDGAAQRPLGVDLLLADAPPRRIDQVLVVEDELVRLDDVEVVLALALGELLLDALELLVGRAERGVEARDLGLDLLVGDVALGRLDATAVDDERTADGEPRRRAHAAQQGRQPGAPLPSRWRDMAVDRRH